MEDEKNVVWVVRDLVAYFDSHLTMISFIALITCACILHRLKAVHSQLGQEVMTHAVSSFVLR